MPTAPAGRRPLVIELVGPAGAGKSTLAARLSAQPGVLRASVWNLPLVLVLRGAAASLPTLVAMCLATGSPPWEAMKQMIRLEALRRLLASASVRHARLVVLDEGPIFALSWLRVFEHQRFEVGRPSGWWRRTAAQWAKTLGVVVFLDAPHRVLLQRIRGRVKANDVFTRMADGEIRALEVSYRAAFDGVIAALTGGDRTRVWALPTGREPEDRLIEKVVAALEGAGHGE